MLKIAITRPYAVDGEDTIIRHLLANGFDIVHLRKPDADIDYCRELLQRLTHSERKRVVIHDYYSLYSEFNLRGIHLNKNIASYPVDYQGTRTRSCHSFDEVVRHKHECDYLFLSPIFDSISKEGYNATFSNEELMRVKDSDKVVALGGITPLTATKLNEYEFIGYAVLGYLFNSPDIATLENRLNEFEIIK